MTKNTARRFDVPARAREIPIEVSRSEHAGDTIVEARIGSTKLHLSKKEASELAWELWDALGANHAAVNGGTAHG